MHGSGFTALIISNEEMNDIMKIVKSWLLIKGVSEAIQNEAKEQKGEFFFNAITQLAHSVLRTCPYGPILVEVSWTIIGRK